MAIGAYPRTQVQGTGNGQNPQNGLSLMLLNPSTQQYEAATATTFAGGGGGGDATAANQSLQITEAQTTNAELNLLNAGKGGLLLVDSDAAATSLKCIKIVVNEDAVIGEILDADANDLAIIYNLASKTITKGMVINTLGGVNITDITVTSGSVLAYLTP